MILQTDPTPWFASFGAATVPTTAPEATMEVNIPI